MVKYELKSILVTVGTQILSFLEGRDSINLIILSKKLLVEKYLSNRNYILTLKDNPSLEEVSRVITFKYIKQLHLGKISDGRILVLLPTMSLLTSLHVTTLPEEITKENVFAKFYEFTQLKELRIIRTNLTKFFPPILDNLTSLDISESSIDEKFCLLLSRMENLRKLNTSTCVLYCNYHILSTAFLSLKNLRYLNIGSMYDFLFNDFSNIGKIYSLFALDLNHCSITNSGFENITQYQLKFLSLSFCRNISNKCIDHLSHFTDLVFLNLEYTNITDEGIKYIKQTSIKHLWLGFCFNLTDCCLEHIRTLLNIESLGLDNTNITSIINLSGMNKLHYLRLNNCDKLDNLGHILLIKNIKKVDIYECPLITERDISEITSTYRIEVRTSKNEVESFRNQEYYVYLNELLNN